MALKWTTRQVNRGPLTCTVVDIRVSKCPWPSAGKLKVEKVGW
jgi:hypothetical protein